MHKLMELKEMLCEELEEYGSKDKLDVGGLEIVDKLAHAIKNIDKIIENYEGQEYSGEEDRRSYRGSSRGSNGSYNSYGSYARKRDSMGRYSRGYSRNSDMVEELRGLMSDAPDEQTRRELQKLIAKMEQM